MVTHSFNVSVSFDINPAMLKEQHHHNHHNFTVTQSDIKVPLISFAACPYVLIFLNIKLSSMATANYI